MEESAVKLHTLGMIAETPGRRADSDRLSLHLGRRSACCNAGTYFQCRLRTLCTHRRCRSERQASESFPATCGCAYWLGWPVGRPPPQPEGVIATIALAWSGMDEWKGPIREEGYGYITHLYRMEDHGLDGLSSSVLACPPTLQH